MQDPLIKPSLGIYLHVVSFAFMYFFAKGGSVTVVTCEGASPSYCHARGEKVLPLRGLGALCKPPYFASCFYSMCMVHITAQLDDSLVGRPTRLAVSRDGRGQLG